MIVNVPVKVWADLVRAASLDGVALSTAGLEETGTLLGVTYERRKSRQATSVKSLFRNDSAARSPQLQRWTPRPTAATNERAWRRISTYRQTCLYSIREEPK